MDADWAALNAAQQAALLVAVPLWLFVGWKIFMFAVQRKMPMLLLIVVYAVAAFGATAILILMLGEVPK
jgi:hypothetical protein